MVTGKGIKDVFGQLHTIEALASAFIMIMVLAIVVQTTSLTPLSSSYTNQHIKLELQNMGNDILTSLDETPVSDTTDPNCPSLLKQSIVDWCIYHYYDVYSWTGLEFKSIRNDDGSTMNTPLTNALRYALVQRGVAFNVEVCYSDPAGVSRTSKMIWNGDPSENSVVVSRFIVLHDDYNEIPPGADKYDENDILPDISPSTRLHNVAEVRMTLWVM